MTKKYKVIIGALVIVLVSIIGISLGYFFLHKTGTNYKNITDLTKEYDAKAEIAIAQKNLTESMKEDATRLLKITSELLNMTQVESGNIQLGIIPASSMEILQYAIKANKTQADEKKISLVV